MAKLQYKALNKGIELENQLIDQLAEYDERVVNTIANQLEGLEAEYEELKENGNVKTSFNLEEYTNNQRRLKELPDLIGSLHIEKLKAIEDKSKLKDSLCRGIYAELGDEYRTEFDANMKLLQYEFDDALTKLIEVYNQMNEVESDYKHGLYNVIHTRGIYLTIDRYPYVSKILQRHNLNSAK